MLRIVSFFALLYGAATLKLPSYIKACNYSDPNFSKCAIEHGKEAMPYLINGDETFGVPPLDPAFVELVSVKEQGITIKASNFTVEGARNAELKNIRFDFDNQHITFELTVPLAIFKGHYEIAGKLVSLPISGHGEFGSNFTNLYINYTGSYKLVKRSDGEVYAEPVDYELDFQPGNMRVHFTNLFNGNKLLGDTMIKFMNDNWRLVMSEIGKPSYKALGLVVHELVQVVAQKVPISELFLDNPPIPAHIKVEDQSNI